MTQLRSLGEALATRAADTNERFRLIGSPFKVVIV